jgi:hypothetical protein
VIARSDTSDDNSDHRFFRCDTIAVLMVCATVSCGNTSMSWNARASPNSASATGPMPEMLRPMKKTSPSLGVSRPVKTLTSVVLPAPFGPTIASTSPEDARILMPSSARKGPNDLPTLRVSTSTVMRAAACPSSDAVARKRP